VEDSRLRLEWMVLTHRRMGPEGALVQAVLLLEPLVLVV